MRSTLKRWLLLAGIILLALGSAWIVWPQGSKIDLKPLGINYEKTFDLNLGLDLQGGSHLVYKANFTGVAESDQAAALSAVRDTIERRVNSFGVSEPVVQSQGTDKIVVELPGIKDVDTAIEQIGQTPLLEFKVENPNPTVPENVTPDENGQITIDPNSLWLPTGLSGKQLKRATADFQGTGTTNISNEIVVRLEFNDEGRELFSKLTTENINKRIAIFLDGEIISAPNVQNAITDGIAIISGDFQAEDAKQLATRLNSGALPVPIDLVSQQNVGATLGQESIQKSVVAGLIGLIMVALFMIIYYRFPGFLAVIALAIYTLMSIAVFKIGISITAILLVGVFFLLGLTTSFWFGLLALVSYLVLMLAGGVSPVTLTLAGIAGFVLSIGMAVDANILIFERFKEEIRGGKDVSKAIEDGFSRAWPSIRDSNMSSLITTLILYMFGTPSIKGFAITLGIGIILSMFTAITITRTLIGLFVTKKLLNFHWLFGVSKNKESLRK